MILEVIELSPLLNELLKKHILPIFGEMSQKEKDLTMEFLANQAEGIREILNWLDIDNYEELEKEIKGKKRGKGEKALLKMIREFVEKKNWIWEDKWEEKHFIWEHYCFIHCSEDFLPELPKDLEKLKEIDDALRNLEEEFAKGGLEINTTGLSGIKWHERYLYIDFKLASKALNTRVKPGEELKFKEASRIVKWLLSKWENFLKEAEQKGWILGDGNVKEKKFIWDRWILVDLSKEFNAKAIKEILEALKEIEKKGAKDFLKAQTTIFREVWWHGHLLDIPSDLASKALGMNVRPYQRLSLDEVEQVIDHLLNSLT